MNMFDSIISYNVMTMDQMRSFNMNTTNFQFRNVSLTLAQQNQLTTQFSNIQSNLYSFSSFLTRIILVYKRSL